MGELVKLIKKEDIKQYEELIRLLNKDRGFFVGSGYTCNVLNCCLDLKSSEKITHSLTMLLDILSNNMDQLDNSTLASLFYDLRYKAHLLKNEPGAVNLLISFIVQHWEALKNKSKDLFISSALIFFHHAMKQKLCCTH